MTVIFTTGRAVGVSSEPALSRVGRRRLVVTGDAVLRRRGIDWVAGSYDAGATVVHNGRGWISNIAANTSEPGTDANWSLAE